MRRARDRHGASRGLASRACAALCLLVLVLLATVVAPAAGRRRSAALPTHDARARRSMRTRAPHARRPERTRLGHRERASSSAAGRRTRRAARASPTTTCARRSPGSRITRARHGTAPSDRHRRQRGGRRRRVAASSLCRSTHRPARSPTGSGCWLACARGRALARRRHPARVTLVDRAATRFGLAVLAPAAGRTVTLA